MTQCELLDIAPADDGFPGNVTGRVARLGVDGTVSLLVACPRSARVRCRGTLTLRAGSRSGRVPGEVGYDVRVGTSRAVALKLRALGRIRAVVAITDGQGTSQIGRRSGVLPLTIVGGP